GPLSLGCSPIAGRLAQFANVRTCPKIARKSHPRNSGNSGSSRLRPCTTSLLHPFIPQPLGTSAGGTKKYACQNFQNFQPFLEENDVDWKIWKIYMHFSRGKRLFSSGKTFL